MGEVPGGLNGSCCRGPLYARLLICSYFRHNLRPWLGKDTAKCWRTTNSKWSLKPKTQPCSFGGVSGIGYRLSEFFQGYLYRKIYSRCIKAVPSIQNNVTPIFLPQFPYPIFPVCCVRAEWQLLQRSSLHTFADLCLFLPHFENMAQD